MKITPSMANETCVTEHVQLEAFDNTVSISRVLSRFMS